MDKILELQAAAQKAAEHRLAVANEMLWADEEGEREDVDRPEWDELAGPFCGCDTCIVREILDAAWPHLQTLALMAEQADAGASKAPAPGHAGSTPAEGTREP
jgi:hypothetical protein